MNKKHAHLLVKSRPDQASFSHIGQPASWRLPNQPSFTSKETNVPFNNSAVNAPSNTHNYSPFFGRQGACDWNIWYHQAATADTAIFFPPNGHKWVLFWTGLRWPSPCDTFASIYLDALKHRQFLVIVVVLFFAHVHVYVCTSPCCLYLRESMRALEGFDKRSLEV